VRNPWLCVTVVLMLGLLAIGGMFGIIFLALRGVPVPESVITITAAAAGGLSTFLVSPPKGSVGLGTADPKGQPRQEE